MSWLGMGEIENAVAAAPPAARRRKDLLIFQPPIKGYQDGTFPVRVNDAPSFSPAGPPTVQNWTPWQGSRVRRETF